MYGIDCLPGYREDADWSLSLGDPKRGDGLARFSGGMESVEKAPGLKSRGELDRRKSFVCRFGAAANGDLALSAPPLWGRGDNDIGGLLLAEPAAEEAGEG